MPDEGDPFPSGGIIIWSGSIANIPQGWFLCDGNNGTPNLTDRFVLHADADSGGTNDVGATGGASTHTLTEAEMPSHTHGYYVHDDSSGASDYDTGVSAAINQQTKNTLSAGSGDAHNNRDKYYALAYIMKS